MKKYVLINENGEEAGIESLFLQKSAQVWKKILRLDGTENKPAINLMKIMRKIEWADSEKSSDKGHFRLYPNGSLVFSLISDWIEDFATSHFEAAPIMTPFIYNWKNSNVLEQAQMFENNIYHINFPQKPNEDFVLRFNGDVGAFEMLSGISMDQSQMPIRFYEMVRSFRYLQSGKITGLWQGRSFTLLDMHSFCSTLDTSIEEYLFLHAKASLMMTGVGQKPYSLVKVPFGFYDIAKKIIVEIAKIDKQPVVVEITQSQKQYWAMKHIIHNHEGQRIVHIQLDLENSKRYQIAYRHQDGVEKNGPIVHTSLGSVERWMAIFLSDALDQKNPVLPTWLSPIQIRLVPIHSRNLERCIKIAKDLRSKLIRVDVDDRNINLNQKIKEAELLWIPHIAVCGDKEEENNMLSVRIRSGDNLTLTLPEIIKIITEQKSGKPFRHQSNLLVSRRLLFRT